MGILCEEQKKSILLTNLIGKSLPANVARKEFQIYLILDIPIVFSQRAICSKMVPKKISKIRNEARKSPQMLLQEIISNIW